MESRTPAVIALVLGLGIITAACQQAQNGGTIGVSVGNVLDDPNAYYGSTITVSGAVDDIITPTVFTIKGGDAERPLLVLSADSIAPAPGRSEAEPVRRDDIVQITGRLREFSREEIASEFGQDFSGVEMDFDAQPVLIAQDASARLSSVIVTPQPGSIVTPPGETETVTDFAAVTAEDAGTLDGAPAHFETLTIAEVIDEKSFWATQDGDSLLVVLASEAVDGAGKSERPEAGQTWEVYGILREVPSATVLNTGWGLSQDLTRALQDDPLYLFAIYAVASR